MPIRQCAGLQNTRTKFYSDLHAPHPRQKRGFYGYHERYYYQSAAPCHGYNRTALHCRIFTGLFKKSIHTLSGTGHFKEDLKNVIKSSLVFSIVPSLSIVVGLFALISVLGTVWSWWRLSVIGSLSYESLISSSVASAIGFSSSAEMLEGATGQQFGVVMILMSIGMLSGFFILLPLGKKLSMSVSKSEENGNGWKYVLSGCFMLCLFAVYIPVLLIGDTVQAAVMLTGLVIAVGLGLLSKNPKLAWLNDFIMAFSMIGGMISSVLWCKLFL